MSRDCFVKKFPDFPLDVRRRAVIIMVVDDGNLLWRDEQ